MVTMSAAWDRTTEFLSDNLGTVVTIAALTIYPATVLQSVLQPLDATATGAGKAGLGLVQIAGSLLTLWGQLAIIALALDPARARGTAFKVAGQRLLPMIGVGLVVLLAFLALCLPVVLILAAGGADFTAMSQGVSPNLAPGAAASAALYTLVLVPLIFWIGARLSVLASVVTGERLGLGAIGRSWRLTKGYSWRIVGVLILFLIVMLVAVLAAQTVFGSIFRLALGGTGPVTTASVLTALVVGVVSTAATVIFSAFFAKVYTALAGQAAPVPATP